MADHVHLTGTARARLGRDVVRFAPDQRHRLLAYLARKGDWASRDEITHLLWPEVPEEEARRNLRRLLNRVRALEWLTGLQVEGERLRWRVDTDVAGFERAVASERWDEALALYGGPLLTGLEGGGAGEFSAWLAAERGRLEGLWRLAVLRRAEALAAAGQHLEAAASLQALLELDDLDEEALGAYMEAAARAGGRPHALQAYAGFAHRLREELGLAPAAATRHLAEAIQAGENGALGQPAGRPMPAPTGLPPAAALLVGRELELAQVAGLLERPACRLLTLTGPGGVGKSRVAFEAARRLAPRFPDGVHLVLLEALGSPELVPAAVAEALGLKLHGREGPAAQVVGHLKDKRALLVLDNFEHLLEEATLVSDLLRSCRGLRVLATSRERLRLAEEWLLPLEGLAVPPLGASRASALACNAVKLFLERAERVRPGYSPGEADLPAVVRVCRLVDGLPLGLELAAAWVRATPVAEIAREIEHSLDFLAADVRDAEERHRSVRATFEHSWRLLSAHEQEVLSRLSVFQGGFEREAAGLVAGASLPLLASLVDKSLLKVSPGGRYDRHPLLHQYTRAKLAERLLEEAGARDRHGAHYHRCLQERAGALRGSDQKAALAALDEELENVRAAWNWAIEGARAEELARSAPPLTDYCERRGRYREGAGLLEGAAAALEEADPLHREALGRLRLGQGRLLYLLGQPAAASRWAERGLALARLAGDEASVAQGLNMRGFVAWRQGDYARARRHHEEAAAYAEARNDRAGLAYSLLHLSNVALDQGDSASAERHARAALDLYRALGASSHVAVMLNNLGCLTLYLGRPAEAVALLREGLAYARDLGLPHPVSTLLSSLGQALAETGAWAEAQAASEEALALARQGGSRGLEAIVLVDLGRAATASGDLTSGRDRLWRGLEILRELDDPPEALLALIRWAEWRRAAGEPKGARALLEVVLGHPATRQRDRDAARRLWAELGPGEPAAVADPAATLAAVLEELLGYPLS